nr:hypothetical protein [Candidatus Sigynarchaeota archaeon]
MARTKKKKSEMTDEEVGVVLPFNRLVSAMITIIVTGLVPDFFLVIVFFWLLTLTPPSFLFLITWVFAAPLLFWLVYFLYLGTTILVTHGFLAYYDTQSKAQPEVLKRQFKDTNHPDYKKLHYYHMRGAIIKYSLWITQKCPFPSLVTRVLNFYGHNTIGKHVLYDNIYPGLEFTDIKDDAIMEVGSSLSTHVVESLYGNLIIAKVLVDTRGVVGINSIVGPGIIVEKDFQVGDNAMTFQNWPLKRGDDGRVFFNGSPAKLANFENMFADGPLKQQYLETVRKS